MASDTTTFNGVQLQKLPPSDNLAQVEKAVAAAPGGSEARRKRLVAKLIGRKVAEPFDQETALDIYTRLRQWTFSNSPVYLREEATLGLMRLARNNPDWYMNLWIKEISSLENEKQELSKHQMSKKQELDSFINWNKCALKALKNKAELDMAEKCLLVQEQAMDSKNTKSRSEKEGRSGDVDSLSKNLQKVSMHPTEQIGPGILNQVEAFVAISGPDPENKCIIDCLIRAQVEMKLESEKCRETYMHLLKWKLKSGVEYLAESAQEGIDKLVDNNPEVFGAMKGAMPLKLREDEIGIDKALAEKIEREEYEKKKQCDKDNPDKICWYCHVTKEEMKLWLCQGCKEVSISSTLMISFNYFCLCRLATVAKGAIGRIGRDTRTSVLMSWSGQQRGRS